MKVADSGSTGTEHKGGLIEDQLKKGPKVG